MNKILIAVASLAVVAAPVAASAQSYGYGRDSGSSNDRWSQDRSYGGRADRADYGRSYGQSYGESYGQNDGRSYGQSYGQSYRQGAGRDGRRNDSSNAAGVAVIAGIAGLLLGSALSQSSHSQTYSQSYGYAQPYTSGGAYSQRCSWQNQAYQDGYGGVEYRPVQVCR